MPCLCLSESHRHAPCCHIHCVAMAGHHKPQGTTFLPLPCLPKPHGALGGRSYPANCRRAPPCDLIASE